MALSDYLAKNYLSADKPSKKRKRKHAAEAGLIIADDNDDFSKSSRNNPDADDDDLGPTIVAADARNSNIKTGPWKSVGAAAPTNAEQAAADAILASAAAEKASRAKEDEGDAPAVVGSLGEDGDGDENYDGPTMASGAMAGLQTAAQVTAALKKREREEKRRMEADGLDPEGKAQETIYRDASGRIINVAMKRAELRRKAEEEERKKREEKEGRIGDVQRREKEERRAALEDAKLLGVARYADDEELNRELKDKGRWNDPAARFLSEGAAPATGGKKGRRKKVYEGASEPNRYGIKPGYRWDGVDRSNGFERKWFAARNKQQSRKELEYAWEMDE